MISGDGAFAPETYLCRSGMPELCNIILSVLMQYEEDKWPG